MNIDSQSYVLNPKVIIVNFSEIGRRGQMLYTLKTGHSSVKRVVISEDAHQLLADFQQACTLAKYLDHQNFLLRLVELDVLCTPESLTENLTDRNTAEKNKTPSYMLFKLTLLSPKIVNQIAKILKPATHPVAIALCVLLLLSVSLFALLRDAVWNYSIVNSEQILLTVFLTIFAIVIHEFGHASAAYRFGARNVSLGIGWYFIFPVAFADLSETWNFNVKQRLLATVAGIFYQSVYGAMIYIVYLLTQNICFYLASIAVLVSVLWNLNPLLRLDGYWILSDLLNVPNLRKEAFANVLGFVKAPFLYRAKSKSIIVLLYGLVSILLLAYLLIRLSIEIFRTQGFGIVDVYQKIYQNSDWSYADWLLSIGTFAWKGLALTFLGVQIYLLFRRRLFKTVNSH